MYYIHDYISCQSGNSCSCVFGEMFLYAMWTFSIYYLVSLYKMPCFHIPRQYNVIYKQWPSACLSVTIYCGGGLWEYSPRGIVPWNTSRWYITYIQCLSQHVFSSCIKYTLYELPRCINERSLCLENFTILKCLGSDFNPHGDNGKW